MWAGARCFVICFNRFIKCWIVIVDFILQFQMNIYATLFFVEIQQTLLPHVLCWGIQKKCLVTAKRDAYIISNFSDSDSRIFRIIFFACSTLSLVVDVLGHPEWSSSLSSSLFKTIVSLGSCYLTYSRSTKVTVIPFLKQNLI